MKNNVLFNNRYSLWQQVVIAWAILFTSVALFVLLAIILSQFIVNENAAIGVAFLLVAPFFVALYVFFWKRGDSCENHNDRTVGAATRRVSALTEEDRDIVLREMLLEHLMSKYGDKVTREEIMMAIEIALEERPVLLQVEKPVIPVSVRVAQRFLVFLVASAITGLATLLTDERGVQVAFSLLTIAVIATLVAFLGRQLVAISQSEAMHLRSAGDGNPLHSAP